MRAGFVSLATAALVVASTASVASTYPRDARAGFRPERVNPLVPQHVGSGSRTFPDRVGDAVSGAPDISGVTVANDDQGNISMTVMLVNEASNFQPNEGVLVAMDTDENIATGSGGFDYVYSGVKDHVGLFTWNGSTFAAVSPPTLQTTGPTSFRINRSDLGNTTGIAFFVETTLDNGDSVGDDAPDGSGVFTYRLALPGVEPPLPKPTFAVMPVGVPHAGKRFVVSARVMIGSVSASPSALGCAARIGTSPLKTAAVREPGPYRACVVTIPIRTAGKRLTVTLVMQYKSVGTTRRLGYTIRT